MRPQPFAGEPIASAFAVIGHPNGNVDRRAIEADRQRVGNVAAKPDLVNVAVEQHCDPALAEPVKAERPHFGRVGTIAIGMKV